MEKTVKYSSDVQWINLAGESGIYRGSAFVKFSSSISFLLLLIHGWEDLVSAIALTMSCLESIQANLKGVVSAGFSLKFVMAGLTI